MRKILIVGATSAIAEATAQRFAKQGHRLFLAARRSERLESMAADLKLRGADSVGFAVLDANDFTRHAALIDEASTAMQGFDTLLIAHGSLPNQAECAASVEKTLAELTTNALSVISLCTLVANRFEAAKSGTIAVIGSVAGDRGRQSNYIYGTAKGAVGIFLDGLRNRLYAAGVQVVSIKPGFVDTPMTASFKKGPLWASADQVAAGIERAIEKRRDVVYLPGFWRLIMLIIRHVPETIFKRLKL